MRVNGSVLCSSIIFGELVLGDPNECFCNGIHDYRFKEKPGDDLISSDSETTVDPERRPETLPDIKLTGDFTTWKAFGGN